MDPVRHILEIYGAIDRAVTDSEDPALRAAADALIPGVSAHPGWYKTLHAFLYPDEEFEPPTVEHALSELAGADADTAPLTNSQKVRLLYALSSVVRLNTVAPLGAVPTFDVGAADFTGNLRRALAKVAPEPDELPESISSASFADAAESRGRAPASEVTPEQLQDFLAGVASSFQSRKDFDVAVRPLAAATLRSGTALDEPLCETSIATINGVRCVVIDTAFGADDLSLENLKSIVNPYNWHTNYPQFFLEMRIQPPPDLTDGWHRVREKVRVVQGFDLLTPLKYLPYEDKSRPLEATLEYDLDESRLDSGDRKVTVDRGYIRLASTDAADPTALGVQVSTRKIVHIKGIEPWIQALLVCQCGYGTSSADFLLKAARNPAPGSKPFPYYPDGKSPGGTTPAPGSTPPTIHFVPAAVEVWTETAEDLTNSYLNLAEKWLTGGVTYADVADYYRKVGGDLASAPWNYLRAMTTPRPPGGKGDDA